MKKTEQFEKFIEWYDLPLAEKEPLDIKGFSRSHHVSLTTLYKWQKAIEKERSVTGEHDSFRWLNARSLEADKALIKACEKGNAQALRTFYQLTQKLVEQQEIKHQFELSPDENIRIGNRIIQRLRDNLQECGGICPVCSRPQALLEKSRIYSDEDKSTQTS